MRSSVALAALVGLGLSGSATPVVAEPSRADVLFSEGKALSDKKDWKGACEKFEQAIQMDADAPGTMLNLGRCHENLGHIGTALVWYQKASEHAAKNHMDDDQKAARARTAELTPRVPALRFEFTDPLPAGGRLFVDGTQIAQRDQARLLVDPGHHTVDIEIPHKAPTHREVDVVERDDLQIRFDTFAAARMLDPGRGRRRRAYLVGGIGLGLFVAQGAVGFGGKLYLDEHPPKQATHWNDFSQFGLTSVALVGVAGIAVGAYLYLTAPTAYEADHATAWVPIAAPDQLGVAYAGRF